jgi:REP element-mobilizing transposase RayT
MSGGSRRQETETIRPHSTPRETLIGIVFSMYKPRLEIPDAYYHLFTRGNSKRAIFLSDLDRTLFLFRLGRTAKRQGWTIYAYCLMTNHYHILLRISDRGLSQGMCELNGGYALGFNARHGRSDHVFGRRFKDVIIKSDAQLLETCRYIVLNPVRAGICAEAGDWPWSSYRESVGLEHAPSFLAVGELLRLFHGDPETARDAFRSFVSNGHVRRQPPGFGREVEAAAG